MKKLFITLAFVVSAFFCQAQFFLGGNLGFDIKNGKIKTTFKEDIVSQTIKIDRPQITNFTIAPNIGYMFSDNMGIGIELSYNLSKIISKGEDIFQDPNSGEEKATITFNSFSFTPYFRWVFAEFEHVKLYADAKISIESGNEKYHLTEDGIDYDPDPNKIFSFGIGVVPGLQYNLNDNISINANLNLLSLGYMTYKRTIRWWEEKDEDETYVTCLNKDDADIKVNDNSFGIGINAPTLLTVGFFYNF